MKTIRFFAFATILCLSSCGIFKPKEPKKVIGVNPIFIIDSVRVKSEEFYKLNAETVAAVIMLKKEPAEKSFGKDGKEGVAYIYTKKYAKTQYWKYFQTKSDDYKKLVSIPEDDSSVQYILNGKILKNNFEGTLFLINDERLISIEPVSKEILIKEFGITDKELGFKIEAREPKGLNKK